MLSNIIKKIFGSKHSNMQTPPNYSTEKEKNSFSNLEQLNKSELVWLESVYRNQEYVFRRATESNRIILGELLESVLGLKASSILSMGIAYRRTIDDEVTEHIVESSEEVWNYNLFSAILKNKTNDGHYSKGLSHETTLIIKTQDRNFIIVLTGLGGSETMKYMRVSILSPSNLLEDDGRSLKTQNAPLVTSFVLTYCEDENCSDLLTFSTVEDSVKNKRTTGEELTDLEQEYAHGQFEFRGQYYIGYGKWLYEQSRFYDAHSILERAYNYMRPRLDYNDKQKMYVFFDVCNTLGRCLSFLGREEEACFYFRQGVQNLTLKEANLLALSHARLGNPIAFDEMNNWMIMVAQKYGSHENWTEEIKQFSVDVPATLFRYKKKKQEETECNYGKYITVGDVLSTMWGLKNKNVVSCMFIYDISKDSFLTRIENADEICKYPLNREDAANKVFVLSCSCAHYETGDSEDKSILCSNAPMVIATHSINGKEGKTTIRVDMMRQNFTDDDDKRDFVRVNIPLNATFTIGVASDTTYSIDKRELQTSIEKAQTLMDEHRFLEAQKLGGWIFESVLDMLKDEMGMKFDSDDNSLWDLFYQSSYIVGFCLMELGKPHAAAYYLDMSSRSMNALNVQEYINCLTNTRDLHVLDVIENALKHSPKPDSEESVKNWNFHMAFLKRRKAYVLIDMKHFDEAKQMLTEMLNDPLCREFAQGELKYLITIKSEFK